MTTFPFRNGFEEGIANIFAIAFQYSLGYNVEIFKDNRWLSARMETAIEALIPKELKEPSYNEMVAGGAPLYISDDIAAILSTEQIALAIASNPTGNHEIQWDSQTKPHPWQSDQLIHTHVAQLIGDACPKFIHDTTANAIDDCYWYVDVRASTKMTTLRNVYLQREAQAWIPCRIRRWVNRYYTTIIQLVKSDLRQHGTSTVPYIGTFTLKGTRVSFKASRHLKNRIKGQSMPQHRLENGRAFGGEKSPEKSIPLWYHTKHSKLSKRRQFVVRMANAQQEYWQNKALANVAFQIFCDAFIFRLTENQKVTWSSFGTFRPDSYQSSEKPSRIYFRKSSVFDNDLSE